ncbi:MAG: hypothetical protein ACFFCZ_00980 [Promethearchaeota archaeon]
MVKKNLNFPSEDDYWDLKVEATKNRQNIGEFIITLLKFWKEHHKNDE